MIGLTDKKEKASDENKEAADLASMITMAVERPEMRTIAVYGDINEERCAEAVYGLLALDLTAKSLKITFHFFFTIFCYVKE